MAYLLEFFIELCTTAWQAVEVFCAFVSVTDASLHGPRRSPWPWIVTAVAVILLLLLLIVVILAGMGKLPW